MGTSTRFAALSLATVAASIGCNSFDEKQDSPIGTSVRVVPTDTRPVLEPAVPPPPITGGTLLSLGDRVAVADPARDRVSLTTPNSDLVEHIPLDAGSQPFRMTQDASGSLYVVLRGTGEVARISLATATLENRLKVCAAPRGIDYDALNDEVVVACAEGKLVNIVPGNESIKSEQTLEADIRDVVVQGNRRYVSRFRSAEVLFIEDGQIIKRVTPTDVQEHSAFDPEREPRTLRSTVAWRMVADPLGGVMMSHQRVVVDEIDLDPHAATGEDEDGDRGIASSAQSSPYGGSGGVNSGSFTCDGIVQSTVTAIDANGKTTTSRALAGVVLPVDLAVSSDGQSIALANAGALDPDAPTARLEFVSDPDDEFGIDMDMAPGVASSPGTGTALLLGRGILRQVSTDLEGGCEFGTPAGGAGPSTSVAFTGATLVSQERAPAVLHQMDRSTLQSIQKPLGGEDVRATGHEIFFRDSGSGLACASCHPEGEDDGHVWKFTGLGPRKTQNLSVPLKDTAPFHWDGSLANLDTLMDEVFVARMGGVFQSEERLKSLENWMFSRVAPSVPKGDTEAVARGEALFNSPEVACATCHSGSAFTDNQSYHVGTTAEQERLQVPPLSGLLLRPPYMHNGCAKTLHQRFDPACGGGDRHGRTSQLKPDEVNDLVAYLSSL